MYYLMIENGNIIGASQALSGGDIIDVEVTEELYNDYRLTPNKYMAVETEIVVEIPDYDEEGNPIGAHTETQTSYEIILNPNYEQEELILAKQTKYNEANEGAKQYLNGDALYEFEESKHIEATDGNIAKFTAYALAYITGQLQPTDAVVWNTKEDETVELNQEQVVSILNGLGQVQAYVWAAKFPYYISLIEQAETVEEVNTIVIDYTSEVQE